MAHFGTHAFRQQAPHASQSSAISLGRTRVKVCRMLAFHSARASGCLPHQSMHLESCTLNTGKVAENPVKSCAVPTLFLMSSSSAARMMARLAVTCSLMAEMKASSPVPDISSVITPPLHGHENYHVTSQVCLEHFSP